MRINFNTAQRGATIKLSYAMPATFPRSLIKTKLFPWTLINSCNNCIFSWIFVRTVIVFPGDLTWLVTAVVAKGKKIDEYFKSRRSFSTLPCLFKGWWFEINVMRLDIMRFPKREIKNDWTRFSDSSSPSTSLPTLSWWTLRVLLVIRRLCVFERMEEDSF